MSYPKEITDEAFANLSLRRSSARNTALRRREEISQKLPQVLAIENELLNTSVLISKAILAGGDVAARINQLRNINLQLQEKRTRLLNEKGYPFDYLEQKYSCDKCNDTGFLEHGMCECLKAELKQLTYKKINQVSDIKNCTFDNFSLSYYKDSAVKHKMQHNFEKALDYAKNFGYHADSLFMVGGTGLGKTHLSLAVAGYVIEKGFDVVYTPVQTLLNKLEKDKFSREIDSNANFNSYMEFILGCDLLILDDLGAEFPTQFTISTIYNIINSRLIEKQPTIINSNLDLQTIENRYSERIVSRLIGGYSIFPFHGNDIRIQKKQQN